MWRVARRSLGAHKLRFLLTLLTIVLGIAFITGTYVFTDSLKKQFDELTAVRGADITVSAATELGSAEGGQVVSTLPESTVDEVAAVAGVASAAPVVRAGNVLVLDDQGEPISRPGPPTIGRSWPAELADSGLQLASGEPPGKPGEIALLQQTAEQAGVTLGGKVRVDTPLGGTAKPTVTGLVTRGLAGGAGGTLVLFDLGTAQADLVGEGRITSVEATLAAGTSPDRVADSLEDALGPRFTVATAQESADELASAIGQAFSFINTFLLAFGLIALFVSAFLIFNTFSMLVAQRTRELALLRAVGATRGQVRLSVIAEALLLGAIASTLGLLVGMGVSQLLRKLFALFGAELPGGSLVVAPRTVALAYAVGVVITLLSALLPARRASAVAPVAAMRDDASPTHSSLVRVTLLGSLGVALAAGIGWLGVRAMDTDTGRATSLVGLSAAVGLLAMIAMAPAASRSAIGILGWPLRSTVGRIAVENGRRNPRRTAATASALAIGLALMTGVGVIAASARASVTSVVDSTIGADFIVLGKSFQPFTAKVAKELRSVPGVTLATGVQQVPVAVGGIRNVLTAVDPEAIVEVLSLDVTAGSLAELNAGGVGVDTKTAEALQLKLGSKVELALPEGKTKQRVVMVYEPAGLFAGFTTSLGTLKELGSPGTDTAVYLRVDPDLSLDVVRADIDAAIAGFAAVQLQDQTDIKAEIDSQFNQLFGFIYALLALAVIVAFLGIVNTLSLSVFERTREVGLLRAVGTLRGQVRRMLFLESVLIAVFGAVTGLVVGMIYGVLLRYVLAPQGIEVLAIPFTQVAVFLVLGAVGGILAAAWPASRAAKLDVLRAIATE
ncbi:MAG: ABC transporter permease [Candidatus Nanopelagicales bacterium]